MTLIADSLLKEQALSGHAQGRGELRLDEEIKRRLLALSPATADRLLRVERQRSKPHGLGTTKPGTLLKESIPLRTFAD
jgi:hypothetical protein